jgi:hypothetical protein
MGNRKYSTEIQRVWRNEIAEAERLVQKFEKNTTDDGGEYIVQLDPEDFLDLCAGKWHEG